VDRATGACVRTAAANLAKITDIYTLKDFTSNPNVVDDIWFEYEKRLADCIDQLIAGKLTAIDWASVLVPFVACLLVRGPDFDERINDRLLSFGFQSADLEGRVDSGARIMEIQRLLAPILVAQWTVITLRPGEPLITNDLAFVPVGPGQGISIPLGPDQVLQINPRTFGTIASLVNGTWMPVIRTVMTQTADRVSFNKAMAENTRRFLFGPDCALVKKYLPAPATKRRGVEPQDLGFICGTHAIVHEFVWHRFVSALQKGITPEMVGWDFDFYFEGLKRGWVPPLIFPHNLPDFEPGLRRNGDDIEAVQYDPPDPMPTITRAMPRSDDDVGGPSSTG
jgi:hypothetical protein